MKEMAGVVISYERLRKILDIDPQFQIVNIISGSREMGTQTIRLVLVSKNKGALPQTGEREEITNVPLNQVRNYF